LDSSFSNKGFIANEISQPYIEEFVSSVFVSKNTKTPFISKVDLSITGGVVSNYLKEKMDVLNIYTRSLLNSLKHNDKRKKDKIMNDFSYNILNKVGHERIVEICLHYFLVLLTQFNTSYGKDHSINSLIKV